MLNIKHVLLPAILLVAMSVSAQKSLNQTTDAKHDAKLRQQFETEKVTYITEKLELTTEEAEQFWKLYNEYKKQERDLKKQEREIHARVNENTTDLEFSEINKELSLLSEKRQRLRQSYNEKYLRVLGARRLYYYYKAEESYKALLLNKMKKSIPVTEKK
ncbi:MAG: hypothetical protein MJZ98_03880 [Paludibacteraceae bacterium]|nr:hypothetical protein [Paludibacteraceae bacterium]